MNKQIEFTWADAWLLHSIAVAAQNRPASLADVIAVGDYLEHTIFTFVEIQCGLARLVAGGHVEFDARTELFTLGKAGRAEYERIARQVKAPFQQRKGVEAYLHVKPSSGEYDPNRPDPRWIFSDISNESYQDAVKGYRGRFRGSMPATH